jgi:hypothetical protein
MPAGSASLELVQRFPATLEQLAVVVKKLGDTKLTSPQVARQQDMTASGETFIAGTGGAVAAGQPITLTIDNLPHHTAIPRWTALGIASMIVVVGAWLSRRSDDADARAAERKRLIGRREKLFADLVRLETERRSGKVGDARYESRREVAAGRAGTLSTGRSTATIRAGARRPLASRVMETSTRCRWSTFPGISAAAAPSRKSRCRRDVAKSSVSSVPMAPANPPSSAWLPRWCRQRAER